ncbi:MAG: ATP synthase F1 subunit epsilon [Lachnospiraceae bacterium]|nr:ATP synthase F1 subunit epsilon [Lachnospiraceae bacterium]
MTDSFVLKIITPERLFYEGRATFVEFTTVTGPVGIYKNHEPMTLLIAPGVLHIHEGEKEKKAALHTGFAEVTADEIRILAGIAEWPEEIDKNRAEQARILAERRIRENGSNQLDEIALRKAIARIEALKS